MCRMSLGVVWGWGGWIGWSSRELVTSVGRLGEHPLTSMDFVQRLLLSFLPFCITSAV